MFGVIDPISPEDKIDGVPVRYRSRDFMYAFLNECDLIDHLWPNRSFKDADYVEDGKVMQEWAKSHKATWYTYTDHRFNVSDAINLAIAEGNTIIIFEDLS